MIRETFREPWVDFVQIQTLCRRAGETASGLARVAAKEIVDNALDASPKGIEFAFHDRTFIVQDFGPGIAEARIPSIFSIKRASLSSKRWRRADRGQLGNGTRVALGVVHVSGGCLLVESNGVGRRLTVRADGETVSEAVPTDLTEGTRISITFGPEVAVNQEAILRYAALCQSAAGSAFGGTKSVPDWFDYSSIRELVRDMPKDTSVLDFARLFDITDDGIATIKGIAARTSTGELLIDENRLATVIHQILSSQKGERKLRRIGKARRPDHAYAYVETAYKLGDATLPAIVEAWVSASPVANRKTDGSLVVETIFANRTPALMARAVGSVSATSKEASVWLQTCPISVDLTGPCNFSAELAITGPELPLLSDGKAIALAHFSDAIEKAMQAAMRKAYLPPLGKVERQPTATRMRFTIKEVVYSIIEDVYDTVAAAGIGAPPRMLMYKCRPEILRLTGRSALNYATFNSHLEAFQEDFPELTSGWSILYDDRGHFIEPNGETFGLGTVAVERFIRGISQSEARFEPTPSATIEYTAGAIYGGTNNPANRFSACVFVEKEGYFQLIRKANIAKRFDVAFASSKGMSNRAIRRLLDQLAALGIKTFCLHDCDINGLGIAYNLSTSNDRYQFENQLDFIDMGVRLSDAEELGLVSEPFHLGKVDRAKLIRRPERYGASDAEIEMMVDRRHRVEIDAMTPQQLIDFIERKLTENGIRKVVADESTLQAHFQRIRLSRHLDAALEPVREDLKAKFAAIKEDLESNPGLVADLHSRTRELMEGSPSLSWQEAVAVMVSRVEGEAA